MDGLIRDLEKDSWPLKLSEIPEPPKQLRIRGQLPKEGHLLISIVGSRKASTYGRDVVRYLLKGLKDYPISIVSGLALGIDGEAHREALKNNLHTIAIPGSGLSSKCIYPQTNRLLAEEIVNSGGALISEYDDETKAMPWTFPRRNRIMAGISDAVIIVEAEMKSGTLITARLALDYGREVFVLPANIFSPTYEGPHYLIKNGATPIRSADEILEVLKIKTEEPKDKTNILDNLTDDEILVTKALIDYPKDKDELAEILQKDISDISIILMSLAIKGVVLEEMGQYRITK